MSATTATPIANEDGVITKKENLFDLGIELESIFADYDRLIIEGGSADEFLEESLKRYFEETSSKLEDKIEAYVALIVQRETYAEIRKSEADRLRDLAKSDENLAKRLRKRLHDFMSFTKNTKIETKFRKVWVQGNGGTRPIVWLAKVVLEDQETFIPTEEIPEVDKVPERFVKVIPEQKVIDNDEVRAALASGETLEFARLADQTTGVRFK